MFERYREAREQAGALDLIPIMNLMVTLIPFLMLGAAFYHIGVIPASVPTQVERLGEPPSDAIVTVNLEVRGAAIVVSVQSATVEPEVLAGLGFELPRGPEAAARLTQRLLEVKARYPRSDTVVVLPDDDVRYAELVTLLDAAREQVLPAGPDGLPVVRSLFPVTVFSKRPVADATDAGVEPPEGEP
ncbi:MAG: biopolymer transporter ExbD [bacterium]